MAAKAAIIGVGQTRYRFQTPDRTWPELAQEASRKALEHAELQIEDIDAVVLALAPSALVGVNEPEKWAVDAVGAVGKPYLRVNTGGATGGSAAQAAYYHVASACSRKFWWFQPTRSQNPRTPNKFSTLRGSVLREGLAINAINMCALARSGRCTSMERRSGNLLTLRRVAGPTGFETPSHTCAAR